ncbi:peptidase M76 family-domain-containing protein [Blastocladiella britannica]|nr:peptidase M76 family-domain-containing protein [Blastocladiella britannica]
MNQQRVPPIAANPAEKEDRTQQPIDTTQEPAGFAAWRAKLSRMTGLGLTPQEQATRTAEHASDVAEAQYRTCERWKHEVMRHSPLVRFLTAHLSRLGCDWTPANVICQPCDATRSAGFSPNHGVVLCENRIQSKAHLEESLAHELIHALDHCRAKLDWNNCLHHACSEIRAASLSGDCSPYNEWMRGNRKINRQHQTCVKRRAILSLKSSPLCSGGTVAEDAVQEVWASCFADTWPFDEIYP